MIETLRSIDLNTLVFFNQAIGHSEFIDMATKLVSENEVLKGIPLMVLFWGLWFAADRLGPETRPRLTALLVTNVVAIVVGRAFASLLPARLRPMQDADLLIRTPLDRTAWDGWSSMPSDHAVMFFAMATAFFFVNRWAGLAALVHAAIVISLPRVMLGLHFPTDILVGGAIGALVALVLMPSLSRAFARHRVVDRALAFPHLLYPALFFVTFQSASMFESLRRALDAAADAVRYVL